MSDNHRNCCSFNKSNAKQVFLCNPSNVKYYLVFCTQEYIEVPFEFAKWKTTILYQMHCPALYLQEPKRLIVSEPETKGAGKLFIIEVKIIIFKKQKLYKEPVFSTRNLKMPVFLP